MNSINYSMVFVFSILVGAFIAYRTSRKNEKQEVMQEYVREHV
ncbi:hypothetical protein [Cellulosilyticum ruminicola]|nr:hypothetical protein [Cellulosilyticum ruminicola]